jgi:hypothetical protein
VISEGERFEVRALGREVKSFAKHSERIAVSVGLVVKHKHVVKLGVQLAIVVAVGLFEQLDLCVGNSERAALAVFFFHGVLYVQRLVDI